MSSWIIKEQSCLPNKVLKCTSHFWWLISPKLVFLVVGDKSKVSGCVQLVFFCRTCFNSISLLWRVFLVNCEFEGFLVGE